MNGPLDEQYLTWLYSKVGSVKQRNKSKTYWSLLRQLYQKEFVWHISNDDNRVEDGRALRDEFFDDCEVNQVVPGWLELECSFLEMLIGLSRRLAFEGDGELREWFWHLLGNLDLLSCTDRYYDAVTHQMVNDILDRVIDRTYAPSGHGGLFPLQHPHYDQRQVELWYQLNAYLLERF